MSDSARPFTEHVTKTRNFPSAAAWAWAVAIVMTMTALLFLMFWLSVRNNEQRKIDALQTKLDRTRDDLANALAENQTNQDLIASLQSQIADLEKDKETAAQMAKGLENEMRANLESKDVTISQLQGKLTVNILDRVLFDSGEAVLKPAGQAVMQKIAAILTKHPEIKIHVIGHTDNVPIRPGAHSRFASNWELSTARALSAVHYLTEQAGVDPRRVGAVGYGEFRPIADNSTPEGRAKNRQIAITILPDELAGSDVSPMAQKPAAAVPDTNTPATNTTDLPPQ